MYAIRSYYGVVVLVVQFSGSDFPSSICFSFLSIAFQFIPGFGSFVLTPNFTDSPGETGLLVVKIITPCGVFSPVHPLSVLKDSKLNSLLNQILNELTRITSYNVCYTKLLRNMRILS